MIDNIDKEILYNLQLNSKMSNQELADKVALSPSPCLRRVKRLEEEGFIEGYVAKVNPQKVNLSFSVLISVGLREHDPEVMANFEKTVQTFPQVLQCYLIAGQTSDYMLHVVTESLEAYQNFLLNKLMCIKGVGNLHSSFILRRVVDTTALPLEQAR